MGKYNLKNIMLGIGIGLVIASMANINRGSSQLTVEQIKKEAEKHNLIVLTVEEIINKQAPEEKPAVTPAAAPTQAPTPTPAPAKETSSSKVDVSVKSGMSSEAIAELLLEKGLIKDTKAFLKRLGELKKDDRLKVGSFQISKGTETDEIIAILTR